MPSFILIRPTVWPQCTNVTARQRTDNIGRTVLHTVAQKSVKIARVTPEIRSQTDRQTDVLIRVTMGVGLLVGESGGATLP